MAKQLTEKRWLLVGPLALIANGTVDGILEVGDSKNLYVKRPIWLRSSAFPEGVLLEIKGFITDTRFYVGPHKENIGTRTDVSAYLVADGATVTAPEHSRSNIPQVEHERAVFEEEPVLAKRVILVDEYGNHYNSENPIPTDVEFTGSIDVSLDGFSPTDPDSVQITGSEDGTKTGVKRGAKINSSNELSTVDAGARAILADVLTRLGLTLNVNDASTNATLDGILAALGATLSVSDTGAQTALANILAQLGSTLAVSDVNSQTILSDILAALSSGSGGLSVGTEDGTPTGTQRVFVNNIRQMILASHDREQELTYADFGNKNQRITQITYSSPTVGAGVTAVKTLSYTLVGTRYRRDSIVWSLV